MQKLSKEFLLRTTGSESLRFSSQEISHWNEIKTIALKCLAEFGLSLAGAFLVGTFAAAPIGAGLAVQAALVQLGVNFVFRGAGSFISFSLGDWMASFSFAHFTGYNIQSLLHETGHAATAFMLYKNPRPMIELYPFEGGTTQYSKTQLSWFGKKISPPNRTFLLTVSGAGLTLLISSWLLALGVYLRKKHPNLSRYLISWGVLDFFQHATYAYSALKTPQWALNHDFVRLRVFGIHPLAATITLICLPILIVLGVSRLDCPSGSLETG